MGVFDEKALKPCPFCGSAASLSTRVDEDLCTHNMVEWTEVRCGGCAVSFEWPTHGYHDQDQDPSIPLAVYEWQTRDGISYKPEF